MKEIARLTSKDWGINSTSLSSFIKNAEILKLQNGVDEIYFWPEIYETFDFDKLNEDNLSMTPVIRTPILVIGILETENKQFQEDLNAIL